VNRSIRVRQRRRLTVYGSTSKVRARIVGNCWIGVRKEGHIDHLVSASQGGANNISNRVLSCATCNEKEKLDKDWKQFLARKVGDEVTRIERNNRIERWVAQQQNECAAASEALLSRADHLAEEAVNAFDVGINSIRSLR